MRYLALARVYLSLSGRAALPVGMPIFFGVLVVACVVFGPTGMRASELAYTLRTAPLVAVLMWFAWIVLVFPAARLALVPPSSSYLRWLPAPRAILYLAAALATWVVEWPWVILFAAGEGVLSGLSAGFGAIALHAAYTLRPWGWTHGVVLLGWALSAFVPHPAAALGMATVTMGLAVKQAVDRAPEVSSYVRGTPRVERPEVALARVHVMYLVRKEPVVLGRVLVMASLAGLVLPLAARGHDLETGPSHGALALGIAAFSLLPAMSGVGAAVIRSERLASWLLDGLGASGRTRVVAAALAAALCGAVAGLVIGVVASMGLSIHDGAIVLRVLAIPVLWGALAGATCTCLARETEASPRRGDRGLVLLLVLMFFGVGSASWWGERVLGVHTLLAMAALLLAPQRWERLRRRRGTS